MTEAERIVQTLLLSLTPGEYLEMRYERFAIGKEPVLPDGWEKAGVMMPRPNFFLRLLYRVGGERAPLNKRQEQA